MSDSEMIKCVACAEEIKAEALLCKFCQTRQDDPNYGKTPSAAENSRSGRTWKLSLGIGAVTVLLGSISFALVANSRAETAKYIAKAVETQVYKLSVLNLMGPLKSVSCSPQGISIIFPTTDYKCFAQDATGSGLMYKAKMEWATGIYTLSLDRG